MPIILSKVRYESERERIAVRYYSLQHQFPNDERWKKLERNIVRMKKCYNANKVCTIKTLRFFEKYQLIFQEEQRATVVQAIELLKKLLWHKKLNKEE